MAEQEKRFSVEEILAEARRIKPNAQQPASQGERETAQPARPAGESVRPAQASAPRERREETPKDADPSTDVGSKDALLREALQFARRERNEPVYQQAAPRAEDLNPAPQRTAARREEPRPARNEGADEVPKRPEAASPEQEGTVQPAEGDGLGGDTVLFDRIVSDFSGELVREDRDEAAHTSLSAQQAAQLSRTRESKIKEFMIEKLGEEPQASGSEEKGEPPHPISENEDAPPAAQPRQQPVSRSLEDLKGAVPAPKRAQLLAERKGLGMRLLVTLILTLVGCYLALAQIFPASVPAVLPGQADPFFFTLYSVVVAAAACAVNYKVFFQGWKHLLHLRPQAETVCSFMMTVALVHAVYTMVQVQQDPTLFPAIYTFSAILSLVFYLLGKILLCNRAIVNWRGVGSKEQRYTGELFDDDLARVIRGNRVNEEALVCTAVPSEYIAVSKENSEGGSHSQKVSAILTIMTLFGGLVILGLTFYLTQSFYAAFTAFTVAVAICLPYSSIVVHSYPLWLSTASLAKRSAYLINIGEVNRYCDVNGIVLSEEDILPDSTVLLHGIKTFGDKRIDEAIIDAASVCCVTKSSISSVFLKIIQGNRKILYTPDSLTYEDGLGISAWVNTKRILLGNRQWMLNNNIDVPSRDYEHKYTQNGRKLMYLSTSGELSAMFIISYNPQEETARLLRRMQRNKTVISLKVSDPNLTAEYLAELFSLNSDYICIIPDRRRQELEERFDGQAISNAGVVFRGKAESFCSALLGMSRLKRVLLLSATLCVAATILGYALCVFLAITSGLQGVSAISVVLYQLLWVILPAIIIKLTSI